MATMLDLDFPFRGAWLVQNSPADRVPSHGTDAFASAHAIDFVPVDERGRTAAITLRALWRTQPPELFPGFGRPVLAPVNGVVVARHGDAPDHDSYRGLPSIGYALSQRRRAAAGWVALAGNHVMVEVESGEVIALCHLQRGSVRVSLGQQVSTGDLLGSCGNSGNSTEPHVHVQAMSSPDPSTATAVAVSFRGGLPRNREVVRVA